jgi:hypothetical protein
VNPSRWREINSLFHELLDLPAVERAGRLAAVATQDAEMAREVRSLLASHERTDGFLDGPVWAAAPELLHDEPSSLVGRQIGVYRIVEEIGRGGMGVVYAAEDQRLGRMVAIKALPPEYTRDPARRARLTREARAAAALSHPAIATIYTLEDTGDALYIVGELVRGRSLRHEIASGPLSPDTLVRTLQAIADALDAAHRRGIVHRDLKPENVMRGEDGQIKVLDFGLARWTSADAPSMTRLTEAGAALGTPGYMAPEQLSGGSTDARSDLFSFGVMAWEIATGVHPFGSDPALALGRMAALMEGRAALPGQALSGLDRIVMRCLRAAPDDRYPSAAALLGELQRLAPTAGNAAAAPAAAAAPPLWWWQFHQISLGAVDAATPVLALLIRRSMGPPYGRWIFLAVLALATIAVTLRLNLLFTSRVHAARLAAHRARLFPWIAVAESGLAAILLGSALHLGADADIAAAPLLTIALVLVASLAIIEPATTSGAGLGHNRDAIRGTNPES